MGNSHRGISSLLSRASPGGFGGRAPDVARPAAPGPAPHAGGSRAARFIAVH
ncbi:hypothetical protein A33K_13960 [Burkholderia humptydooensis MSMB43]|uniref:Uncharacterized protein n=1 Tax=Burkholderia humptydooensis MSMB43 TaxID=441157 RepID=A0ABN0GDS7_9BURK|nr:hypothetical protein A33K_13960 [Burkholderia humptydooensis MSMB43]